MPQSAVPKTIGTAPPFIADIPKRGQNTHPSRIYKPRFFTEYLLSRARQRRSPIGRYVPAHEVSAGCKADEDAEIKRKMEERSVLERRSDLKVSEAGRILTRKTDV